MPGMRLSELEGLTGDPTPWLLEPSNPCVRWRTLRELLGRGDDDPHVREAAEAILRWQPVERILRMAEDPAGFDWPPGIKTKQWARPGRDLAMLSRFGVPPGRPELRCLADSLKAHLPDNRSSDCYQPQHVAAVIRYGDPDDPDVIPLVHRVIANELLADGNRPPTGGGGTCCISHSCHNAVARSLDCVLSVPRNRRTPQMQAFLDRGAAYLAGHRLYQKNHHRFTSIRSEYLKLRQPWGLDWLTDVPDLLDIATRLGMSDSPALVPALQWLLSKQLPDGRWPLETVYHTDRPLIANLLRDVEPVGAPGKWVTLNALLMLKRCAGLVARIRAGEEFPEPAPPLDRGFVGGEWPYDSADESQVRADWAALPGMADILAAMVAFAQRYGLGAGWNRPSSWRGRTGGFSMGPDGCREWCCATAKLVPARTMKAAFPVARTTFLAPRGTFTEHALCERLRCGRLHDCSGRARPGSWVEKTLWHVRVEHWTPCWDTVGIAIRDVSEIKPALSVMREALEAVRRALTGGAP